MFTENDWEEVDKIINADLVQFVGGHDVSPDLYGQASHKATYSNIVRDKREAAIFKTCRDYGTPMAGICRGGQFLNVMCGGSMWQDIDGHANGKSHGVLDLDTEDVFDATSTHHQQMIEGTRGKVLAIATESTRKEKMSVDGNLIWLRQGKESNEWDVEVVHYPDAQVLCFQPHPEFPGVPKLRDTYFDYLNSTIL
jgi:gamma-glutamyl-gamma-aminobutyrate hydrolase PuuD